MQSQVVEFRVNNNSLTSLHAKIKQTYIFVYMYVYGQTNSKEWFVTLFSENPFTDLRYSTTVTFPLATFPDIFHPFFSHFEVGRVGTISFPVLACVSCFVVHISCLWHKVVILFLREHPYFRAPHFFQKKVSLIFYFVLIMQ